VTTRLLLTPGELDLLRGRLNLPAPPGFAVAGASGAGGRLAALGVLTGDGVAPAVAADLVAACAPQVAVHVVARLGAVEVTASLGIRDGRPPSGGGLVRTGPAEVELSGWPVRSLPDELTRVVPPAPVPARATLHVPLDLLRVLSRDPEVEALRAAVTGSLRATVVRGTSVVGQVLWLGTDAGWIALEPAEVRDGVRWARARPVGPGHLAPAVAVLVARALA
jgi:hypothetical protein